MNNLIAQFGRIDPPPGASNYGSFFAGGASKFLGNTFKMLVVIAGVYAVFNFVLAGYAFMSAGGDPKRIEGAWAKIWQTMLGLIVAAGAFVLGGIISTILFGNPLQIFELRVYIPGTTP